MAAEQREGCVNKTQISRTPRHTQNLNSLLQHGIAPQAAKLVATASNRWDGKLYTPLAEAFDKVGQAEQIIRNWLPSTGVSFILAKFGLGKTLMLLDQALCLATDRDWLGNPTAKGRFSIYLCGEDQEGTLANADAWCKQNGVDPADKSTRIVFVPMTPNLMDEKDCQSLVAHIRQKFRDGIRPVIFLDTWQRSTATAGQNEDKDMQTAIRNAELIGKELGGPVIAASHPPKAKSGTISGSGVIENSSVAIWLMTPVGQSKTHRQVTVTRIKGAGQASHVSVHIEKRQIDGQDNYGCPRTGAVLVNDGAKSSPALSFSKDERSAPGLDLHEKQLLLAMTDYSGKSFVKLAEALGWQGENGKPNDSRVKNKMKKLARLRLVSQGTEGSYVQSEAGVALALSLRTEAVGQNVTSEMDHPAALSR